MRSNAAVAAFCLLATAVFGGMSGTYSIKPAGGGDFLNLYAAGEALVDSGMSGNCVFEVYGDSLDGAFGAWGVAGSDSWTTTFRPGPGANPIILGSEFYGEGYNNVKIEGLRFLSTWITIAGSSGWRISGCRFSTHDWGVKLVSSSTDTVDANTFDIEPKYGGHYPCIVAEGGSDNVIFNNVMNPDTCGIEALVSFDRARNTRFVFNTLRMPPWEVEDASCIEIRANMPCEVRNNVFVLARAADTVNACVSVPNAAAESILLDYNCYFAESLGCVGARPFYPYLYQWDAWRGFGFEVNGIYADPMFVSATDLHLRPGSPCNTRATPIAGINADIDGDPRDPTHPDMGADEIAGDAVEDRSMPRATGPKPAATILSGAAGVKRLASGVVFDAMGRRVANPKPGVYFVREAVGGGRSAVSVRKVVITK